MEKENSPIELINTPLPLNEVIVRSSVKLVTLNEETLLPYAFGSGFIVRYKERFFLITVLHVVENDLSQIYIEVGIGSDRKAILKKVGGIQFFSQLKLSKELAPTGLMAKLQAPDDYLDIAFAEVQLPLELQQEAIDFGSFKVENGGKIFPDLDGAAEPGDAEYFGFAGYVQQKPRGTVLYSRPTFKYGLTYHRTDGDYHIFLVPENSIDSDLYKGTSGAPVFDDKGFLVGVARGVVSNTKMVYVFSIMKCKALINMALLAEGIKISLP